jgi:hypothetical protein
LTRPPQPQQCLQSEIVEGSGGKHDKVEEDRRGEDKKERHDKTRHTGSKRARYSQDDG